MQRKVGKEILRDKLLAYAASAVGNGDKQWSKTISETWNAYTRAAYYLEAEFENIEKDMLTEYNKFKHIRPKVKIGKDGSVEVSGVPKY
jgi:hypothetical protein